MHEYAYTCVYVFTYIYLCLYMCSCYKGKLGSHHDCKLAHQIFEWVILHRGTSHVMQGSSRVTGHQRDTNGTPTKTRDTNKGWWGIMLWKSIYHVTRVNETCHTRERVMSHMWRSHVTHENTACHTCEWVMSQRHGTPKRGGGAFGCGQARVMCIYLIYISMHLKYMYTYIYIYLYIYIYIHMYIYNTYIYVYFNMYMYIYICVRLRTGKLLCLKKSDSLWQFLKCQLYSHPKQSMEKRADFQEFYRLRLKVSSIEFMCIYIHILRICIYGFIYIYIHIYMHMLLAAADRHELCSCIYVYLTYIYIFCV